VSKTKVENAIAPKVIANGRFSLPIKNRQKIRRCRYRKILPGETPYHRFGGDNHNRD
jgi:hypothetical protein